jgi:hypothetical protein
MRKEVPEIGFGDFSFVSTRTPQVLAMHYTWQTVPCFSCTTSAQSLGRSSSHSEQARRGAAP